MGQFYALRLPPGGSLLRAHFHQEYVPIPWSKLGLSYNRENAAVTASIDATKAQLDKAPLIKGDNYATLLAHGFADEVRRYFGTIGHNATPAAAKERR